jgi:hypothetical protein
MNQLTTQPADAQSAISAVMFNPDNMHALLAFADLMAKSSITVPDHLKGKPADCMAIAMQSMQWGMNPFAVAQKTHIVSGRLGYEAQLVNAVVKASHEIRGAFHYEFRGEGQGIECRVGAVLRGEDSLTWGEWLRNGDVTVRNSPLWKVNPKQQLGYLQVKNWARLYAPGAILGVYTPDELERVAPAERHMGMIDQETGEIAAPAAPAAWPDDKFAAQLPRWTKAIQAGMKTAGDIVTLARSKGALTAAQEEAIRAVEVVEAEPIDEFVSDMETAEAQS